MIILGIIVLIAGFLLKISILWAIGLILLVIGAVLMLMGRRDALSAAAATTTKRRHVTSRNMTATHRFADARIRSD